MHTFNGFTNQMMNSLRCLKNKYLNNKFIVHSVAGDMTCQYEGCETDNVGFMIHSSRFTTQHFLV